MYRARPCAGLFDRIIAAIKREEECKQTRKWLFIFISLFIISIFSIPFSLAYFIYQWNSSGIGYFISAGAENLNMFFVIWQDVALSILESLPITGILLFSVNMALFILTVRLFLYKKGELLNIGAKVLKFKV